MPIEALSKWLPSKRILELFGCHSRLVSWFIIGVVLKGHSIVFPKQGALRIPSIVRKIVDYFVREHICTAYLSGDRC